MRRLALVLSTVVALLAPTACGDDTSPPEAEPQASVAPSTPTPPADPADPPPTAEAEADAATAGPDDAAEELFPDVLDAEATRSDDGTWRFSATLSSPYDSPERYADAWRVLAPDGTELDVRALTHDHASEQPFTRSLAGVEIPEGITTVTIEGRDQVSGWGGATVTIELPTD